MKKSRSLRFALLFGLAVLMLASAAAPAPAAARIAEKSDEVRLTIENKSSGPLYVWLEGPAVYYFALQSEETQQFAVARGDYDYRFRACGDTVTGELNLNSQRRLVMPVCGARAVHQSKASDRAADFDIGSEIRIVEIDIENDSDSRLFVIMTGPTTYVFTFEEDEEQEYTLAKGDYKVQVWGCGRYGTRNFSAFKGKTLILDCPRR
jgi:hypothetical protein